METSHYLPLTWSRIYRNRCTTMGVPTASKPGPSFFLPLRWTVLWCLRNNKCSHFYLVWCKSFYIWGLLSCTKELGNGIGNTFPVLDQLSFPLLVLLQFLQRRRQKYSIYDKTVIKCCSICCDRFGCIILLQFCNKWCTL